MAVLKIAFLSSAVLEFFTSMAIALVAVYLGMSYLGYLDFGAYGERLGFIHGFFILLLAPEFFFPLRELGQHYHARAEAIGASEELMRILSLEPMSVAANAGGKAPPTGGDIRFASVNLSYGGERQGALIDVCLDIPFGRHTVIVGESGAGKTSLFNLLLGFVAPDSGRLLVGGTPMPLLDLAAWRRRVAWIGQQPVLFYGTIADNVRIGRPAATDAELRSALKRAGAWSFVQRLPGRLETPIGEQGVGLSRGQAQRVALARVFLRGAPVLLLDEPLSSLDAETERQVATVISDFARGRTLIMLTHRLDAVHGADRVVVMDGGTVSFQGTPAAFDAYRHRSSSHTPPEAAP
jgi:ATP-binding cassette subfamily C protein CydD